VQISVRAAALRSALERATGAEVNTTTCPHLLRLTATIPPHCTPERWAQILQALEGADRWGSTDEADQIHVWSEIEMTEGP